MWSTDEMIRDAACECPERGLLLLRVRDELRLTLEAYQTLYHNSISYGRKKAVQAEVGITELDNEIRRLETRSSRTSWSSRIEHWYVSAATAASPRCVWQKLMPLVFVVH